MSTTSITFAELQEQMDALEYSYDQQSLVRRWIARGDGVAIYENGDLGHRDLGLRVLTSFGSSAAQLEGDTPPERLPDGLIKSITGGINWRYVLVATYRKGA